MKWVMRKRVFRATLQLSVASSVLLILPAAYLFRGEHPSMAEGPVQVLTRYLKAAYARDFREAYRWISSEDRRLKDQKRYVLERGPFNGFTLELAKKLSSFIEAEYSSTYILRGDLPDGVRQLEVTYEFKMDEK